MFKKVLFILVICSSLLYAPFISNANSTNGYYYWDDGSYYGQLQNGVPHGYGTSTYINGETYKGQWSKGLMNGHGTYNWPDGKLYVGAWKDGHMNGQGLLIYSDGSTYSGEFYQDRPTGNGESAGTGIRVVYNSEAIKFDVNPFTAYKRIMVPVRGVFEAAGAEVGWDASSQTIKIKKGGTKIVLVIDSIAAEVNGESSKLDVAPLAYRNRVFVPLRFVAENLGAGVTWDSANKLVWIVGDTSSDSSNTDYNDTNNDYNNYYNHDYTNDYNQDYSHYSTAHAGPQLTGWEDGDHLVLSWDQINADDFNGYKVVISEYDSSPCYPDNGYLFYITDRTQTRVNVDNSSGYNGGDFGGRLEPGHTYYFSITALYSNEKVPGNVIVMTYPY